MMQAVGAPGYTPAMQATPSASAVNIQIFEPKAYAAPQQAAQNPIYAYPQQSMYAPQPYMNQYQQFMPQQPMYQPMPPQAMYQPMPQMMPQQPMPQLMPQQPMMPQQQMAPQFQPQGEYQLPQQQMPAPVLTQTQMVNNNEQAPVNPQTPELNIQQPQQTQTNGVDVNSLISGLQSQDNKVQEDAITKIANLSQGEPEMQNAVLSEPVMKGLADIIRQDTSGLQGPSEAQIAAINKAASGATLTPEEEALTQQLAPKTAADKNRVISMFTLAMLQKNQRDEIDRYNQTQDAANQVPQLKVNDLIGYNEIENAARNESEKEVKLAAIQALSYIARPEDKEALEPVLTAALQDQEPLIQQAATEVLTNIGSQAAPQAQPQQAPEQMSKKERKAMEKAQKQAEKEAKKAAKQAAKNPQQAQVAA